MTHPYCSRLASASDGVITGTGVPGDIYVFLPVNKARWGQQEFNDSWSSVEEREAIRQARRSGVTVRLYNPPGDPADQSVVIYPGPRAGEPATSALEALLDALRHRDWRTDHQAAPRLALCTQGTRDRCCAKWGFAVYREARDLYQQGRFPFEPIECSHLGGDRFAATGIVFPSGNMYGHLDQLPLLTLADAEALDRVVAGHYRGRVFESPLSQVVRAGLALDGYPVSATSKLQIQNPDSLHGPLTVEASGHTYEVTLCRRRYEFYGDCRATAQDRHSRETRVAYVRAALLRDDGPS